MTALKKLQKFRKRYFSNKNIKEEYGLWYYQNIIDLGSFEFL